MSDSVNVENSPLEQYKVSELREELRKKGLSQKGVKKELVKRLEEAMRKEEQFEMLRTDAIVSEDGYVGSANSEEAADSEGEGKAEVNAEFVIPDQVDPDMNNQQPGQAAGKVDDRNDSPVAEDSLPVATNFTEISPQDDSKSRFSSEPNSITQLESNEGNLGISGSEVQTEVAREIDGLCILDDITKVSQVHALDINRGENFERDSDVSTLDASMVKENLEGISGLASLEYGEGYTQINNGKTVDDDRELIVANTQLEAADNEEACQVQDTVNYQLQNDKEGTILCPVFEVKQEVDYRPADGSKFDEGFVMFRDEVKAFSSVNLGPLLPEKGMEQSEVVEVDRALAEQVSGHSIYKDEKPDQYGKLLEGAGTSGRNSECKGPEYISGLQEYKMENSYKPVERDSRACSGQRRTEGLNEDMMETSYKLIEPDSRVHSGQKRKEEGLNEDMMEASYRLIEPDPRVYSGQKIKEEEIEARQQEPAKRQRRWNSGNKLSVEPVKALTTGTVKEIIPADGKDVSSSYTSPSVATAKIVGTSRPLSSPVNADSLANGGRERHRTVPPATRLPTTSLRIDRFLRPFTHKAVKDLLSETGTFTDFWMDQIKTHCYVTYSTVAEAIATRNALYNLQWPVSFGNFLIAEFVDPEEVTVRSQGEAEKVSTSYGIAPVALPLPPSLPSPPVLSANLPDPPPPPPLPLVRQRAIPMQVKEPDPTLDDLFKKTNAKPHIYYLPLTDEEVALKLAAKKRELQLRDTSARA